MDIREQNYNTIIRGFKFIDKYGNEGWLYFHNNEFIFTKDANMLDNQETYVQYTYYSDGATKFRVGVRNTALCTDIAITSLGFNGTENIDWENLHKSQRL